MPQWYFKDNVFYPNGIRFTKSKRFTSIPNYVSVILNPRNMYSNNITRMIPVSLLASSIQNLPMGFSTEGETAFFDIETERDGLTFTFGNINGTIYDDIQEFTKELHRHKIRIGYNIFRFDYVVLQELLRTTELSRLWARYNLNKFVLWYLRDGVNIDMSFMCRLFPFKSMKMYEIARELDIDFDERFLTKFDENKCKQDIEVLYNIYWALDIPLICKLLNNLVSMDIHILQNVFFDRLLRNILLQEYLNQNLLPITYPKNDRAPNLNGTLLKESRVGEFKNVFLYDVENAYPNTAIRLNTSVYPREKVFPDLERKILKLAKSFDNDNVRKVCKRIANAEIGYMNDRKNYFCNPMLWYNVVMDFNREMKKLIPQNIIWANIDGFMTLEKITPKMTANNVHFKGMYNLRLKNKFKYIKLYHVNKYLGVDIENKIQMKGFKNFRFSGLRILEKHFTKMFPDILDPKKVFGSKSWKQTRNEILENEKCWIITVRKTSEVCTQIKYLEYWDSMRIGFNDVILDDRDREQMYADWEKQF